MPRPAPPPRLVARLLLLVPLAVGRAWAGEGPAVDGVVAALEPARFDAAAYPPNARAERVSGTVVVRVTVDPGGVVVAAAVARSVRPDLDAAALAAAQAARFPSGAEGGTDATYVHAYVFTLTTTEASGQGVPGSVHLRLRDEAGAELRGVPARFTPADGGPERVFTSDEAGRVVAPFLPEGAWRLRVEAPGRPAVVGVLPVRGGVGRTLDLVVPDGAGTASLVWADTRVWRAAPPSDLAPDPGPAASRAVVPRGALAATPGAGEDALRALGALPGVLPEGDGLGTFSVRAGEPEDVRLLLDGVPVVPALPIPSHAAPASIAGYAPFVDLETLASLTVHAGVADATQPTATGGILALRSWRGEPRGEGARPLGGAVDLSAREARLFLTGPVGRAPDLAFAVSARRSYASASIWALDAVGLLDAPRATPEHDAVSARLAWRPGPHRLRLTLLRTSAHLSATSDARARLVPLVGAFDYDDTFALAAVDHGVDLGPATLESTAAASWATARVTRGAATAVDAGRAQLFARSDLVLPAWDQHLLRLGVAGALAHRIVTGTVYDSLALPTDASAPVGDYGAPDVALADAGWEPDLALYAEHAWTGPLSSRLGVRATWVGRTGEVLPGPTVALSVPLPSGTVPRVAGGLYHHVADDPVALDPARGNPALGAERAWQLVVGVDQALPLGDAALLTVEGHAAKLEDLAVTSDTAGAVRAPTPSNDGYGDVLGADVRLALRAGRFEVNTNASLVRATRTNPLNVRLGDDYAAPFERAVSGGLSLAWQVAPRWRLTGRYELRTGRPVSSVEPGGAEVLALAGLNDARLGTHQQLDVRLEWRRATPRLHYSAYVDVLNVLNSRAELVPSAAVAEGVVVRSAVSQLPVRPFLGVRVDF